MIPSNPQYFSRITTVYILGQKTWRLRFLWRQIQNRHQLTLVCVLEEEERPGNQEQLPTEFPQRRDVILVDNASS